MARLEQLVEGVQDEQLRRQIEQEIAALKERTRFGLVCERHLPETALIADLDLVEIGALVPLRKDVDKLPGGRVQGKTKARLVSDGNGKELEAPTKDLFVVKPFGQPICPILTPVDVVERSSERPCHAVINGENFHALPRKSDRARWPTASIDVSYMAFGTHVSRCSPSALRSFSLRSIRSA